MRVRIKFFAIIREKVGTDGMELELEEGRTVQELLELLRSRFPATREFLERAFVAVNRRYVNPDTRLKEGDEVAIFPPVSGGGGKKFEVTSEPLSVDEVVSRVNRPAVGGIVCFVGVVRGETRGRKVLYLEYEAYPEMAEEVLAQIGNEIKERWPQVEDVAIVHRVGHLEIGEASVVITVAGAHRQGLFEAARYAIERVKEIVPIWKKEVWEGGEEWIEGPSPGR